jgi:hypothetical protein
MLASRWRRKIAVLAFESTASVRGTTPNNSLFYSHLAARLLRS